MWAGRDSAREVHRIHLETQSSDQPIQRPLAGGFNRDEPRGVKLIVSPMVRLEHIQISWMAGFGPGSESSDCRHMTRGRFGQWSTRALGGFPRVLAPTRGIFLPARARMITPNFIVNASSGSTGTNMQGKMNHHQSMCIVGKWRSWRGEDSEHARQGWLRACTMY